MDHDAEPINKQIIEYIMCSDNEKSNASHLKHIYLCFGRSEEYRPFVLLAKEHFFHLLYKKYNVDNIDALLRIKIVKGTPSFFPVYIDFHRALKQGLTQISFPLLHTKQRKMIRLLSLYHCYVYVFCSKSLCETVAGHGDAYMKFLDKNVDRPLTFRTLKAKRIHNLEYYTLVDDAPNVYDRTYLPIKEKIGTYIKCLSSESHSALCLKI